jgi:glyoxylase-like metal-dependent hydrolase (beta-lactamase superfamily II)
MKSIFFAFCYALVFVGFSQQTAAQNFDSVEINTIKITDKIYMLEGSGGNIGVLVGKDGMVLIDDQYAPLTEKIKSALKLLSDKPVRFIINTHFHFDHTGGNGNFGGEGAIIVAQENSRARMTTNQFIATFSVEQKAASYDALPKVTFTESVTLHLDGETVQVFHVKHAHTDGDAIIHFKESNVFHSGDVFIRYGLPFIDQPNGGSIGGMINGVDTLLSFVNNDSKIIPGHGSVSRKKDLIEYKNMLETVQNRVLEGIKRGMTLKEIVDTNPTKEFNSEFSRADFLKSVYDSLKK